MSETPNRPATMPIGGTVAAIVPQTFEEIQRVAVTIINAGIAPASLVKFAEANASAADIEAVGKRNVAAVATCIMAGAELGLPPMVSLRAFTVINGRPALYADGNIAVIRKAKDMDGKPICEFIRQGFEVGDTDELTFAWVAAKRRDNGEEHREEFSVADAKQAGLWDDKEFKRAKVWRNSVQGWHDDVPNDSVWHRYPRRMMMWRAAGYCLRWLFADVLGGMPDEYEAREIEGMVDITPAAPRQAERQQPPPVPEDDEAATIEPEKPTEPPKPKATRKPKAEPEITAPVVAKVEEIAERMGIETTVVENTATGAAMVVDGDGQVIEEEDPDPAPPEVPSDDEESDPPEGYTTWEGWWGKLAALSEQAGEQDALDSVFEEMDVYPILAGDEPATERANAIYDEAKARIAAGITAERQQLEADGQGSLIDDLPE